MGKLPMDIERPPLKILIGGQLLERDSVKNLML